MTEVLPVKLTGDLIIASWAAAHGCDDLVLDSVEKAYNSLLKLQGGVMDCELLSQLWDHLCEMYGEREVAHGVLKLSQSKLEAYKPLFDELICSFSALVPMLQNKLLI